MTISTFLADDHAMLREGLRILLNAQKGIAVVGEAADGWDAVRQITRLQPMVAVLDIAMPRLNGIDATRQIRQECASTQVVILSMHATSEHIYQALKAGAIGYVLKEAAATELVSAVRAAAQGQRYMNQKSSDQLIGDYLMQRGMLERESPLAKLTAREREVLQLVVEGKTSVEIAEIVSLSQKTVESYRSRLMQKLEIKDVPTLVKFAIQHGLTSLDS